MLILKVNCKSSLSDIIKNVYSGSDRDYIFSPESKKRLDLLVSYSKTLIDKGITTFIEVKFVSKYSARERRIEIVSKDKDCISLYKISSFSKYDKDALDLSHLVLEINETFTNISTPIKGVLLFPQDTDIQFIKDSVSSMNLALNIELI